MMQQRTWIDAIYEQNKRILWGLGIAGVASAAGMAHIYNTIAIEYGTEDALPIIVGSGVILVFTGKAIIRHRHTIYQVLSSLMFGNGDVPRLEPTVAAAKPAVEAADLDGWGEMVKGLSRVNRPILPMGIDAQTGRPVWLDMSLDPHLILTGKSGEGKTRRFLRPLVGVAFATGWQVVVIDETGQHYLPFMGKHRNVQIVGTSASTLLPVVSAIYDEVLRRSEEMTRLKAERYVDMRPDRRFPRLLIVLDEYSNLIGQLRDGGSRSTADKAERKVIQIAQRGRAVEVHLVVVAQRGTSDNVNTTLRQECTPASFYLGKTAEYRYMGLDVPEDDIQSGQMVIAPRRRNHVVNCWHPDNKQIEALMLDHTTYTGRVYDNPTWIPDYEHRVFAANGRSRHNLLVAGDGDHAGDIEGNVGVRSGDRSGDHGVVGKKPASRTVLAEFSVNPNGITLVPAAAAQMATNKVPNRIKQLASPHPSGECWVRAIAPSILEDGEPSAIPSVTAGQVRLIYFALSAGYAHKDIYPLVWGTPSRGGMRLAAINAVKAMMGDADEITMADGDEQ